ncbi:hypothetical protein IQ07DRAFT_416943 [Pyrenochaeta sp. DS3sAY3a]|nr:hypothetical protein IQ07DRAFT_416943 [Pyrenochaeta sp. DS3sAY3a]
MPRGTVGTTCSMRARRKSRIKEKGNWEIVETNCYPKLDFRSRRCSGRFPAGFQPQPNSNSTRRSLQVRKSSSGSFKPGVLKRQASNDTSDLAQYPGLPGDEKPSQAVD